ncbi:hypothetical protein CYANOKiyG1_54900 [Okeania sp. KiyG1]|nr:hypothetical protein CYANOKiyG1_54900 [Okeania sp. KiyG1]
MFITSSFISAEIQSNISVGAGYYRRLAIVGLTLKYVPEQFSIFGDLSQQDTIAD